MNNYQYKNLRFSENYNNKLYCKYFTTIRPRGTYELLELVKVSCETENIEYIGTICGLQELSSLHNLTDYQALLDSGMLLHRFLERLVGIYSASTDYDILLIENLDYKKTTLQP